MTPGQQALDTALKMRMAEIAEEHGGMYFLTDWVVILAGQEMDRPRTSVVHTETRGPGEVPVYTELGLLEHAAARLRARISARWGRS